ncbi:MAG: hypothetical protein L0Y70_27450 [Gemmataceae bacterium]|nr:hypothetical protein [Gemmataceae bacterium]
MAEPSNGPESARTLHPTPRHDPVNVDPTLRVGEKRPVAEFARIREFDYGFDGAVSSGSLTVESGPELCVWSTATTWTEANGDTAVAIPENQHIVIGRQHGGEIEYLDPAFAPTPIYSRDGESILRSDNQWNLYVSRGHFMLRGHACGLVLVNGVPRRGGGIRPPLNGTFLVRPDYRFMWPGEEYVIESTTTTTIQLPNGTVISIRANQNNR